MSDRGIRDSGLHEIPPEHRSHARRARNWSGGIGAILGAGAVLLPTEGPKVVDYMTGKPTPYTLAECIRDKDADVKEAWQKAGERIRECRAELLETRRTCR